MSATQAPKAPPAPNAKSAAPGTKDEAKEKKPKVVKVDYPGLTNEAGDDVLLEAYPEDFDPKAHKPLKAKDFKDETVFMIHKAEELEAKAKKIRDEVESIKKLGSPQDRKKLQNLQKVASRMNELVASLKAAGMDVNLEDLLDA